jgi:hypothetical protein
MLGRKYTYFLDKKGEIVISLKKGIMSFDISKPKQ